MSRALRILAGIAGRGVSGSALRRAMSGRVVVITGASEGIGAASAERLAAAGATVILIARTAHRLDDVARRIEAVGGTAYVYPCDLADPTAAGELAARILREHRRVDVVVSNAGRSINRTVADTADRFHDIARTASVNYLGPVALLLGLLPAMRAPADPRASRRSRGGHIVNVSTAGLAAQPPGWSAYLASKAAFDGWLRSAAPELRLDRVTVSTVYLGLVRTRMSEPTLARWRVPAASVDEAADLVCRAVVRRPRTVWPWWARLAQPLAVAFPAALEWLFATHLRVTAALAGPRALHRAGLLAPSVVVRALHAVRRHGATVAAAVTAGPRTGVAVIDDTGPTTRAQIMKQANAWIQHLAPLEGIGRVGLACAPGRDFVVGAVALSRLGLHTVLIPPETPPSRLPALVAAHSLAVVVHDGRYDDVTSALARGHRAAVPGWRLPPAGSDEPPSGVPGSPPRPGRTGRLEVLSSGRIHAPRTVVRPLPIRTLLGAVATHLSLVPLRPGEPFVLAAPPHHGFGLSYVVGGMAVGAPVVLTAGRNPAQILDLVAEHGATVLVALPSQLLRLAAEQERRTTPSGLAAIVSGAASLPADLHARVVAAFGNIVFNIYGSTEAGWSSIATPADLLATPGTVGRAPRGVTVRIRAADGRILPPGEVGEVHVTGWLSGRRESATGDYGLLDPVGRLILRGRVEEPTAVDDQAPADARLSDGRLDDLGLDDLGLDELVNHLDAP